jgi:DNA-binding transcriptional ArsR family regulator
VAARSRLRRALFERARRIKADWRCENLPAGHFWCRWVPQSVETDASTRHRVASSILEHGPSTAAELAERLGLTPAAIRRHLDVLLAAGQLQARERRIYGARGRGRPAKVFVLTDAWAVSLLHRVRRHGYRRVGVS